MPSVLAPLTITLTNAVTTANSKAWHSKFVGPALITQFACCWYTESLISRLAWGVSNRVWILDASSKSPNCNRLPACGVFLIEWRYSLALVIKMSGRMAQTMCKCMHLYLLSNVQTIHQKMHLVHIYDELVAIGWGENGFADRPDQCTVDEWGGEIYWGLAEIRALTAPIQKHDTHFTPPDWLKNSSRAK